MRAAGTAWLLLGALFVTSSVTAADPRAVESRQGMVAAAEELAARAGVEIMQAGGNAVDAAVAVGFALAVTYPVAGNIGGGGFLVANLEIDGERHNIALDFRERAPAAAHANLYVDAVAAGRQDASTLGHLAAGVPGSVAGMLLALERWGTLDRKTVLAPAIRLAADGFPMTRRTARMLAADSTASRMRRFPATAAIFYPGGDAAAEGELFRQPDLARTLRLIAENGRGGFYEGPVAEAVVAEMKRGNGIMTAADLAAYEPVVRDAIVFPFRGHTVVTMPPPSSGGVCLKQILGILDRIGFDRDVGHNSSQSLHLLAEAMRRSFADRNRFLGDPDHATLPLDRLLSKEHIDGQAKSIGDTATSSQAVLGEGTKPRRESKQTTHYSVVDRHGNAVAVTTTLNGAFGCKVVVEGAGFLLNNEMDDFAAEPGKPNLYGLIQGEANAVGPGKRPLSSMTPTVVLDSDGRPRHVLGTPGGPTIITNVLQVLINLVVFELPPQAAVNAPKIHHQCLPDRIRHEREFPLDVLEALERRGHTLRAGGWMGDFQLITIDRERKVLLGAADPRGGGAAVGY